MQLIPPERYREFVERGCAAFKPTAPLLAEFELTVMADTVGRLVEDEIMPAHANAVADALACLRSTLRAEDLPA